MRNGYPIFLAACVAILTMGLRLVAAVAQTREEAVTIAREGRTDEAIAGLRKLLAENPNDPPVAFDLAVVLTWAKRPREATDVFEHAGAAEVPEYVLGPMIRAYRDQKRFKEAEHWA